MTYAASDAVKTARVVERITPSLRIDATMAPPSSSGLCRRFCGRSHRDVRTPTKHGQGGRYHAQSDDDGGESDREGRTRRDESKRERWETIAEIRSHEKARKDSRALPAPD